MEKIIVDIRPTEFESAIVYAPFDKAKETLESKEYRIISLEENAKLRIQQGLDSYISKDGNWTKEGVLYIPNKGIFLTKNSPIMQNPREAAHNYREEYFLTDKQVERALQYSVKLLRENILTNRFKDNEITAFAFGEIAEQYGQFLKEAEIKEMPVSVVGIDYINKQHRPFARQMWFSSLNIMSCLDGSWKLDKLNRLRGVQEIKQKKEE